MLPIQKKLIKYNISKRNTRITYLVIHDTGNSSRGANALAHYNYFNGGNKNSSADYFVDDNNIIQLVEDTNYSWHCGDGKGRFGVTNSNSIGVEICVNSDGNYDKAVSNTIELVKYLMDKYKIDINHVVRHYDASRKNCPSSMSTNNWIKWIEFKQKLCETVINNNKSSYTVNYCLEWQKFYNETTKTKAPLIVDGKYGMKTENSLMSLLYYIKQGKQYKYCLEFQKWYNKTTQTSARLSEDGLWGKNTERAFDTIHTIIKVFK